MAGSLAGAWLTRPLHGQTPGAVTEFQALPTAGDDRIRTLITAAVDAAKSAGAVYSDARLTFSQFMGVHGDQVSAVHRRGKYPTRNESLAFGVRAQVKGYWGFASSPVWTKDEAVRLGRAAVDSAKANAAGLSRDVEMAPNPNATSGDWTMPVTDDPFAMDPDEIFDYLVGVGKYGDMIGQEKGTGKVRGAGGLCTFSRQQKAFGSSDGQLVTQRVYRTFGEIKLQVGDDYLGNVTGALTQLEARGAGKGFELIRTPHTREWLRQLYDELEEEYRLPVLPVDVGRYPVLLHPDGVANILKKSIGVATEIDRIMGFEANTTGTSYIIDPDESLGTLKLGNAMMRVTATRSMPGGLARVKWDDEGVAPKDFDLVTDGLLTNLQRNREGTAWMKGYLTKTGQPLESNGCAHAIDASDSPRVFPSDLILHPDSTRDTTLTQLREQIDNGVEFKTSGAVMDFQQSTGLLFGQAFLVKKGKRVSRIAVAGMLFRTSELWGNLQALGGPSSVLRVGTEDAKDNNYWNVAYSSVSAPPALFKEMSIIDPSRKA